MMRRWMPLIAAALVTLLAVGLWQQHAVAVHRKAERKEAWMRYLRGPLSDLLYGSTRMRPLVVKKKLSKAEQAEAREAGQSLERSRVVVPRIRAELSEDPTMLAFNDVVTWHQEIGQLLEPWTGLMGKHLGKEAVGVEAQLRLKLWQTLNGLRDKMLADKTLSADEVLEMNALLFSLQEDQTPGAKASAGR